jgi:UDP-N-acetylglucosamine--N-acetylmuramyl-(pentapeptide) pyrophosphoryl-undecaprenol N-acetylglucosamine transferase
MKILVATGPSGGHIFPAISFIDTIKDKRKDIDTLLISSRRAFEGRMIPEGYKARYISISTVKASLNFKNLISILRLLKGLLESLFIILEFRPDIVVGFGSLVSVPVVLLAWFFRTRTLIHEQNVVPGRANRFLSKFTDRIAISFAQTRNYLSVDSQKIALTGNPIRRQLSKIDRGKAIDFFGFNQDKFTLLVMGGSLGSHKINITFLNAISTMPDKAKWQIIHLTGAGDYDLLNNIYKGLNVNVKLFGFLNQMEYAYNACDIVISRAGATAISEIIFFALPAIIIPYPFAYGHQLENAKVLEDGGCAIVIKENELDASILRKDIESFMGASERIKMMRSNYYRISRPDANLLLTEQVLALN